MGLEQWEAIMRGEEGLNAKAAKLRLNKLRKMVLTEGIPPDNNELRAKVWKLFLRVPPYNPKDYLYLVQSKSSPVDHKIRDDTFRTLGIPFFFCFFSPCLIFLQLPTRILRNGSRKISLSVS